MGGSGFTGYQVIQSMKRAYPDIANDLVKLQMMGYTANQITGLMRRGKGEKVSTDEMYQDTRTEHEKSLDSQKKHKRKAIKQALGILGTGAGIGLAAYQALKYGGPTVELLTGKEGVKQAAKRLPFKTINQPNKQLPFKGGQAGTQGPKMLPMPMGGQPGQQGQVPQLSGPQAPQGPPPQPQLTGKPPTLGLPAPNYVNSVDLVKRLKEENNFQHIIKQGFDTITTADVLKQVLKKDHVKRILDKAPGGLDKVVADYTQYMQQKQQQDQYSAAVPKEPYDDRVQFINPSRVIKMKGPEAQQPQQVQQQVPQEEAAPPPPQQQQVAQAPQAVGPGRQRLQGLMDQLKSARGVTPQPIQQAAPAPMPQAPQEAPLQQVASYPILPPAPKNLPTPAPKKAEKPKAKRVTKADKEEKTRSEYQEKKKDIKDRLENAREREKRLIKSIKENPKDKLSKSLLAENKKLIDNSKEHLELLDKEHPGAKVKEAAKIDAKIDKMERQDISKKGLKDQKEYLTDHIKKAIDNPPEGDKVHIKVPGDGEFNLYNDKDSLKKALDKIEKNWPKDTVKTAENPKHRSVSRNPNIFKELEEDEKREPVKSKKIPIDFYDSGIEISVEPKQKDTKELLNYKKQYNALLHEKQKSYHEQFERKTREKAYDKIKSLEKEMLKLRQKIKDLDESL